MYGDRIKNDMVLFFLIKLGFFEMHAIRIIFTSNKNIKLFHHNYFETAMMHRSWVNRVTILTQIKNDTYFSFT